jgi:hypothetical protein
VRLHERVWYRSPGQKPILEIFYDIDLRFLCPELLPGLTNALEIAYTDIMDCSISEQIGNGIGCRREEDSREKEGTDKPSAQRVCASCFSIRTTERNQGDLGG